jgi:S1-C subfamily serine protease
MARSCSPDGNRSLTPWPLRPGQSAQATLGIVIAVGEHWRTPTGDLLERYVQTDVIMFPGFSGGPLVHTARQALGLNTSALLRGLSLGRSRTAPAK